jgi:TolB protein
VGEDRLLVQVLFKGAARIYSMSLDGSDRREFTHEGDGFPYGMSLSPDKKRVAFHTAGPSPHGYRVWTGDLEGKDRVLVAGESGHLFFGTEWSPDGEWILYQDCLAGSDPGHDWSDVCIGRPDGSEHRALTNGQCHWFGATYGNPEYRGGGSNMPRWTADGRILFSKRLPDSRVAWEFQAGRPDVDHFNREYKPELARGGTVICRLDPHSGSITPLTQREPPVWDFRPAPSPDHRRILFCRAATGEAPALWIMDAGGGGQSLLTRGLEDRGADHPRWLA